MFHTTESPRAKTLLTTCGNWSRSLLGSSRLSLAKSRSLQGRCVPFCSTSSVFCFFLVDLDFFFSAYKTNVAVMICGPTQSDNLMPQHTHKYTHLQFSHGQYKSFCHEDRQHRHVSSKKEGKKGAALNSLHAMLTNTCTTNITHTPDTLKQTQKAQSKCYQINIITDQRKADEC